VRADVGLFYSSGLMLRKLEGENCVGFRSVLELWIFMKELYMIEGLRR
jgi:hypothetical protein